MGNAHLTCRSALSSEIAPTVREYARSNSTILNLYIEKPLRILFSKIKDHSEQKKTTQRPLLVMQAAGGLSRSEVVQPISTLHSGPIGGLMGVHISFRNCMASRISVEAM